MPSRKRNQSLNPPTKTKPMNNEDNTYDDLKKALLLGIFFLALCLA